MTYLKGERGDESRFPDHWLAKDGLEEELRNKGKARGTFLNGKGLYVSLEFKPVFRLVKSS